MRSGSAGAAPADYDLVVIGGGPAGYVGAIRAAQLGLKTALVEQDAVGGVCLNWGCIPTKALLHAADLLRQCRRSSERGLVLGGVSLDVVKLVEHSRATVTKLHSGVAQLLKKHHVAVRKGRGRLHGTGAVEVEAHDGTRSLLRAKDIVLATGARSRPWEGPAVGLDATSIWTARDAVTPKSVPASLLIVGAGAIGMEFASLYSALGAKVHLCELRERVLPIEDAEISEYMRTAFERDGIEVWTECSIDALHAANGSIRAKLHGPRLPEFLAVAQVLVCTGVIGNTEDIGLPSVPNVTTAGGFIVCDRFGATGQRGIHAVGDVAGAPCLAHRASRQAVACVERIAGLDHPYAPEFDAIPSCTFCHPQVASIGVTEQAARARGRALKVGRFPFAGNGKAVATGSEEGFVKTIFDAETGELLGAHMVGDGVTELVQGFAIARRLEGTERELMEVVFPHPTMSEGMSESVLAAFGRALHA